MLHVINSRTAFTPKNLSGMGSIDTSYVPIHQSKALTVLYLFVCLLVPVGIKLYRL